MKDTFAPYAPPSGVLAVIHFYRKRDVPPSVTLTNLVQIGVTEALAPRVMAALKFLNLLHADGTTSDQFRALRYASEEDYQTVLGGILENAYRGVLDHVDLANAGERELNNAFIPYSPGGQRPRMITLFQALAKEAGWPLAVEPKVSSPRHTGSGSRPKPSAKSVGRSPKLDNRPPPVSDAPGPLHQHSGSGMRLSVTEADLDALSESEFDTVWSALGLLQKARRKAQRPAEATEEAESGRE